MNPLLFKKDLRHMGLLIGMVIMLSLVNMYLLPYMDVLFVSPLWEV